MFGLLFFFKFDRSAVNFEDSGLTIDCLVARHESSRNLQLEDVPSHGQSWKMLMPQQKLQLPRAPINSENGKIQVIIQCPISSLKPLQSPKQWSLACLVRV